MIRLSESVRCVGQADFATTLKRELESLPPGSLPLAGAAEQGGRVDDTDVTVCLLAHRAERDGVHARVGVFFAEIVGGCSCGEDPYSSPGYCELDLTIDRDSGAVRFRQCQ